MSVHIVAEVGAEHIGVAVVQKIRHEVGIALAVGKAAAYAVEDGGKLGVGPGIALRVVAGGLEGAYLLCPETEEEHILITEALVHLDVRAVEGADGDRAVEH